MRELTICVSVLLLIIGLISCRSDIPAETTPYRKPPSPEIIPASTVPPNVSGDDIREPDSQTMKAIRQLAQEHPGLSFGVRGIYAQQGPQADTFRVEEKTPFIGEFRLWNAQLEAHEFAVTCLVDHVQTPCTPEESLTQLITLEADEEVRLPLKVCNLARGLHDLSVMFWQDPYADSHNPEAESRIFDSDTYRVRVSIFAGGDTTPPNHDRERLSGRPAHRITDFTISQEIDPRGEHGSFPIVTHLSTSAGKKLDLFVHLNNVESIGIDYAITAFIDYKQVPLYRDGAERIPLHVHVPPSTWQPVAVQIQAPIESGQYEFFVVSTVFPFARLDVETEEYYGIDALINRPYFSARILLEVE